MPNRKREREADAERQARLRRVEAQVEVFLKDKADDRSEGGAAKKSTNRRS